MSMETFDKKAFSGSSKFNPAYPNQSNPHSTILDIPPLSKVPSNDDNSSSRYYCDELQSNHIKQANFHLNSSQMQTLAQGVCIQEDTEQTNPAPHPNDTAEKLLSHFESGNMVDDIGAADITLSS